MEKPHFEHQVKFIRTDEDWYPAFEPLMKPNNYSMWNPLPHPAAQVTFLEYPHKEGEQPNYKVSVWGADDFGMELESTDRQKVWELYEMIKDFTTQKMLEELHFDRV